MKITKSDWSKKFWLILGGLGILLFAAIEVP